MLRWWRTMEIVNGTIVEADAGGLTVRVPYTNTERLIHRDYREVRVELIDNNKRTAEQLRKAWAIMGDIAVAYTGRKRDAEEDVYQPLAAAFSEKRMQTNEALQRELFHLSDATRSEASAFINYLIDFVLSFDVPMSRPLGENADDIQYYVRSCLMHRKCAVCGQKADVHHCDGSTVGMGRNRKEMVHTGCELMPLCRVHHQECHSIGQQAFNQKYHVEGVVADKQLCERLGLKSE